jgi:atypical dual specificity phosphatase
MAVHGFYWLVEGELAGCGRPGGPGTERADRRRAAEADDPARIDADLAWLKGQGIRAVLSLTEVGLASRALEPHGFAYLHLPVDDMTAPSPAQLQRALTFIDWQRASGRSVAVHCRMGQGRTATVLAAYLVRDGMPADAAISRLRAICPGALGSPSQERALQSFAARRDWIL